MAAAAAAASASSAYSSSSSSSMTGQIGSREHGVGVAQSTRIAGDSMYMDCLRVIDTVRERLAKAGISKALDLPQCVMVGGQSAGKSSLLEAYSMVKLPQGSGTKTRCPTVIEMEPLEEGTDPIFSIDGTEHAAGDIAAAIEAKQAEILKKEGEDDKPADFSNTPIRVQARTSFPERITTVDMPGLISDDKAGGGIIKRMVSDQIKNPRSLILAVGEAFNDVERHDSFVMAKEFDKGGLRTVQIITACDKTKSEEQRLALRSRIQAAANSFNDAAAGEERAFAAHFVIARPDGKADGWTHEAEMEAFRSSLDLDEAELNNGVVGVQALRKRIEELLKRVVLGNLGSMLDEVVSKRASLRADLSKIGESPKDATAVVNEARQVLNEAISTIGRSIRHCTEAFDAKVMDVFQQHSEDREAVEADIKEHMSAIKLPWFCAEHAFNKQLKAIGSDYGVLSMQYVDAVMEIVRPVMMSAVERAAQQASGSERLGPVLRGKVHEWLEEVKQSLGMRLQELARRHESFFSRNDHYMDDGRMSDDELLAMAEFLHSALSSPERASCDQIRSALQTHRALQRPRSMLEQVVDRTMPDLAHVAKAQYKEFISGANAEIKHGIVEVLESKVEAAPGDKELVESALESSHQSHWRKTLLQGLTVMQQNEDELRLLAMKHGRNLDAEVSAARSMLAAASGAGGSVAQAASIRPSAVDVLLSSSSDEAASESKEPRQPRTQKELQQAIGAFMQTVAKAGTTQGVALRQLATRIAVKPSEDVAMTQAVAAVVEASRDQADGRIGFGQFTGGDRCLTIALPPSSQA